MQYIHLQVHGDETIFLPHWFAAKFYHPAGCEHCGWKGMPGFSDMDGTGPWTFKCPKCQTEWGVALSEKRKKEREETLSLLRRLDAILIALNESPYVTIHNTVEEHHA